MKRRDWARCVGVCLLLVFASSASAQRAYYDRSAPGKTFSDVVLDLEDSIEGHNFAIVGRNEIGKAIRRRGYPDFGDATIVHFCNLEYARQVLAIDRSLILYMPCRIAVFDKEGVVHAASLLLPEDTLHPRFNRLAHKINGVIRDIIDFAVTRNAPAG